MLLPSQWNRTYTSVCTHTPVYYSELAHILQRGWGGNPECAITLGQKAAFMVLYHVHTFSAGRMSQEACT